MNPQRIGLGQLACYGGLGLPLTALLLPLAVFLPPLYATLPGLTTATVGVVFFLARIWDVVTDVGVGFASDRTKTRWGRRRPWIVAGAPILLIGAWFLFQPPEGAGVAYLLGWALIAYLGWSFVALPYQTWGAELTPDYDQRSRVTASREIAAVIGTLAAILLPNAIMQAGGTQAEGLAMLFWFLAITLPIALLFLLWRVPEPRFIESAALDLRAGMRLLAQNRPFRRLLLAYLANGAANGLPAALFIFFNLHVLKVSEAEAGIALVVYFLAAVAGLPLWMWVGRRWAKHRLWCFSMLFVSGVFVFAPFLGEGDYYWYLLICLLGGSCLGIDQAIPASMQADVIDEDTAAGGGRRAGLYFGLWGMATKLAFALAVGIAYPVLGMVGFDAQTLDNAPQALLVMALLYAVLPVVVKLSVVAVVWNYPLDRARHAELQSRIAATSPAAG